MKRLLAFLILVSFSAQTFGQFFAVLDYYINTGSYAKNCENKNKPQLKCNGQCQLMKKIRKEEKKDQQNPERKITFKNTALSSKSFFGSIQSADLRQKISYSSLDILAPVDRTADVFHPPPAAKGNPCCPSPVSAFI